MTRRQDDEFLEELADAILDGTLPGEGEARDRDATEDAALRQAEIIARIADLHRRLPDDAALAGSIETGSVPMSWGRLTILEELGRGAFGAVYRARDPRLDRDVALKLLWSEGTGSERFITSMVEEGRLLARIHHPNVVSIYDANVIDGRVGLTMEFVRGQTLAQEVQTRGPFTAEEVATVGREIAKALTAVHEAGLLHRDVKTQNVMRRADGRLVLMDFGAGHQVDGAIGEDAAIAGTPLYLAPEVLDRQRATVHSDIYSLGVLLFLLLTGDYPVRGASIRDLREAHRLRQRHSLLSTRPDVPERLATVIERALAADPTERFESAGALEASLTHALEPASSAQRAVTVRGPAVVFVLLAAVGVAALVAVLRKDTVSTAPTLQPLGPALITQSESLIGRASAETVEREPPAPAAVAPTDVEITAQARLDFQPRDSVLITQFENRTGESDFDGAVEYALQREFSGSDVIGLVPDERVDDALRLMRRPSGTVIDRTVGREVALRDGHIKAILAGRIERFGSNYMITAQLIDPADGSVVATVSEEAAGQQAVLPALTRQASQVRVALGENRGRIKGADPNIEQASTSSLQAFQLYKQSYQLGRQEKWGAALEIARQMVTVDPEFASGWIWRAWAVRNSERLGFLAPDDPRISRYRDFADQALRLADRGPEWEQHWIKGSYYTLLGEDARSIAHYEALLRLRPDHYYALNNLLNARMRLRPWEYKEWAGIMRRMADQRPNQPDLNSRAAVTVIREKGTARAAKRYIDRLDDLARSEQGLEVGAGFWRDFTVAFGLWSEGNARKTLEHIRRIEGSFNSYPASVRDTAVAGLVGYYLSLGRAADASRFVASLQNPNEILLGQLLLGWESGDGTALRRLLEPLGQRRAHPWVSSPVYVMAGLHDMARRVMESTRGATDSLNDVARGQLLLLDGQHQPAIEALRRGLDEIGSANRPEYYQGCESLADALWQIGRQQDAIDALETCTNNTAKTIDAWAPLGAVRTSLNLRLADAYRQVGRTAEAAGIEKRVQTSLAVADPDFPLAQRLRSRPSVR